VNQGVQRGDFQAKAPQPFEIHASLRIRTLDQGMRKDRERFRYARIVLFKLLLIDGDTTLFAPGEDNE
jgi:hypothetical protein